MSPRHHLGLIHQNINEGEIFTSNQQFNPEKIYQLELKLNVSELVISRVLHIYTKNSRGFEAE